LLAQRLRSPLLQETVFTTELTTDWPSFLADHQIQETPLLPATAYVEMLLAAAHLAWGERPSTLSHLLIQRGLPLSDDPVQVQVALTPLDNGRTIGRIYSYDATRDDWQLHAESQLQLGVS
jgi:acyl transferase domain-containing protein